MTKGKRGERKNKERKKKIKHTKRLIKHTWKEIVTIYIARESKNRNTACLFDIRLYLTPLGQARQFIETCGTKISSVEGNLFIFGLVCYFCPGSQKNQHLTAQKIRISKEKGVYRKKEREKRDNLKVR